MVDAYMVVYAGLLLTLGAAGDRYGAQGAPDRSADLRRGQPGRPRRISQPSDCHPRGYGHRRRADHARDSSIITNVFPREERGKAIAIWAGVAALGIGLGPLFGGLLLE